MSPGHSAPAKSRQSLITYIKIRAPSDFATTLSLFCWQPTDYAPARLHACGSKTLTGNVKSSVSSSRSLICRCDCHSPSKLAMPFFATFAVEDRTGKHVRYFSGPMLHRDHFAVRQAWVR